MSTSEELSESAEPSPPAGDAAGRPGAKAPAAHHYGAARRRMASQLQEKGITDRRLLEAMKRVPRHLFGPPGLEAKAYEEHALPLGNGQTISSPLTVARMTQALELGAEEKVLEIGTGSGYQSAILAALSGPIFTIERIQELADGARQRFRELGIERVNVRVGDGTLGWREFAPYHAIMVTAGSPSIPELLLEQLADGGRLVAPVGDKESQTLMLVQREDGRLVTTRLGPCQFVPLIGRAGWKK